MSFVQQSLWAPAPSTTRGARTRLSVSPSGDRLVYAAGRSVLLRNLAHPEVCEVFTGHGAQATVAAFAPSGFYVASADVHGTVKIWDATQPEHLVKGETRVFAGPVNDLAWDAESKRIIAVGAGKERSGHAFLYDTLSSVGEITGHNKPINCVALRPGRPWRAVTGSDDATLNFHTGVPYRFSHSISSHSRFVQCVEYAPAGTADIFASCGSDGLVFLHEGKDGKTFRQLPTDHTGSIFSLSWSPDGKQLLTASADGTVKIWDIESGASVASWALGGKDARPQFDHQQVGSVWTKSHIASLSLGGDLNYWDIGAPSRPQRIVHGHQKGITAMELTPAGTLLTGSYDGRVLYWSDAKTGAQPFSGFQHNNQVTAFGVSAGSSCVYSAGMDDTIKRVALSEDGKDLFGPVAVTAIDGIPKTISASSDGLVAALTSKGELVVMNKNGETVWSLKCDGTPSALAWSTTGSELSVGFTDGKIKFFALNGTTLTESGLAEKNRGEVTCLSYSPDGNLLVAADSQRAVLVYDTTTKEVKIHQWVFHTARVNTVAWAPDSLHAASGGLDTNLEVWSVEMPMKHISIKCAHSDAINGVVFKDNNTVVSSGQDGLIKTWTLTHF